MSCRILVLSVTIFCSHVHKLSNTLPLSGQSLASNATGLADNQSLIYNTSDACQNVVCQNGGKCEESYGDNSSEATCDCSGIAFTGSSCQITLNVDDCASGYWGYDCNSTCGKCTATKCDKTTAKCAIAQPLCTISSRMMGEACNHSCTENCLDEDEVPENTTVISGLPVCDAKTEECNYGCKSGYFGAKCDQLPNETVAARSISRSSAEGKSAAEGPAARASAQGQASVGNAFNTQPYTLNADTPVALPESNIQSGEYGDSSQMVGLDHQFQLIGKRRRRLALTQLIHLKNVLPNNVYSTSANSKSAILVQKSSASLAFLLSHPVNSTHSTPKIKMAYKHDFLKHPPISTAFLEKYYSRSAQLINDQAGLGKTLSVGSERIVNGAKHTREKRSHRLWSMWPRSSASGVSSVIGPGASAIVGSRVSNKRFAGHSSYHRTGSLLNTMFGRPARSKSFHNSYTRTEHKKKHISKVGAFSQPNTLGPISSHIRRSAGSQYNGIMSKPSLDQRTTSILSGNRYSKASRNYGISAKQPRHIPQHTHLHTKIYPVIKRKKKIYLVRLKDTRSKKSGGGVMVTGKERKSSEGVKARDSESRIAQEESPGEEIGVKPSHSGQVNKVGQSSLSNHMVPTAAMHEFLTKKSMLRGSASPASSSVKKPFNIGGISPKSIIKHPAVNKITNAYISANVPIAKGATLCETSVKDNILPNYDTIHGKSADSAIEQPTINGATLSDHAVSMQSNKAPVVSNRNSKNVRRPKIKQAISAVSSVDEPLDKDQSNDNKPMIKDGTAGKSSVNIAMSKDPATAKSSPHNKGATSVESAVKDAAVAESSVSKAIINVAIAAESSRYKPNRKGTASVESVVNDASVAESSVNQAMSKGTTGAKAALDKPINNGVTSVDSSKSASLAENSVHKPSIKGATEAESSGYKPSVKVDALAESFHKDLKKSSITAGKPSVEIGASSRASGESSIPEPAVIDVATQSPDKVAGQVSRSNSETSPESTVKNNGASSDAASSVEKMVVAVTSDNSLSKKRLTGLSDSLNISNEAGVSERGHKSVSLNSKKEDSIETSASTKELSASDIKKSLTSNAAVKKSSNTFLHKNSIHSPVNAAMKESGTVNHIIDLPISLGTPFGNSDSALNSIEPRGHPMEQKSHNRIIPVKQTAVRNQAATRLNKGQANVKKSIHGKLQSLQQNGPQPLSHPKVSKSFPSLQHSKSNQNGYLWHNLGITKGKPQNAASPATKHNIQPHSKHKTDRFTNMIQHALNRMKQGAHVRRATYRAVSTRNQRVKNTERSSSNPLLG